MAQQLYYINHTDEQYDNNNAGNIEIFFYQPPGFFAEEIKK
jgi:hypothetical protein